MIKRFFLKPVFLGLFSLALAFTASMSWISGLVYSAAEQFEQSPQISIVSQTETEFIRTVSLSTNDIVYNPADEKIYASQPSAATSGGNSITSINPRTGEITSSVFVGSEPNKLALANDGQTLYVSLDGSYAVRRFDTVTQTAGSQFSTGFSSTGRFKASDLAVSPDNPNLLAIARTYTSTSPPEAGVAVFDNGVQLPQTGPVHSAGSDYLAFSSAGSTLYGTGISSGLKTMSVNGAGITVASSSTVASGKRIKFAGGTIFSSAGHVVNASAQTVLGTFADASTLAFVPDVSVGRAYYLVKDTSGSGNWILKAFDINTFTLIGSLTISNVTGDATSLVRWGANGLAFRTTANKLYLIQTTLIPSEEPIPTPTATPTPTITPTPTPFETYIKQIPLYSKNVVYNPATQKIYASVPSAMGSNGNSVATIEPATGTIEGTVFVGSEPNKLALSSDNQSVYVGLDGARAIRKFDIASQTSGLQFAVGTDNSDGPLTIIDFDASPDNPNLVAVSRHAFMSSGFRGVALFENGVQRPQINGESGAVSFSASTSTLYGSYSNGGLEIMTVGANGITAYSKIPFDGGTKIKFNNGLVYSSRGQIIEPNTQALIGTFALSGNGFTSNPVFAVDSANNRIFFAANSQIRAYDLNTFLLIGTIDVPNALSPTDLKRWGTNGLAVSTGTGPTILIQSTLVNSSEPVPPTTPTPTPTATPTAPPVIPTLIRKVSLRNNDLVYSQADGMIYASVPSTAGAGVGNTISRVNPQNAQIVSSVFIGSEPNKLALSSDGQALYANLTGANAIRRFDIPTQTSGLQFIPQNDGNPTRDIAVMPGSPQTVVVSASNGGTAIYDNGIKRPNIAHSPPPNSAQTAYMGPVEFSDSPNVLYGYNNESTGFDFFKMTVDANGLNTVSRLSNLISGFSVDMKYAGGRLYASNGQVVNPETQLLVGTFQVESGGNPAVAVDTNLGRVFIAKPGVISAYDLNTFTKIGSIIYPGTGGTPTSLVRWGANGLAFRVYVSSTESYINIIQSKLVSEAAPLPTGLNFNLASYFLSETSQTVNISVTRSGEVSETTTVNYAAVDGTATAGIDYAPTSGTLTFAPGETTKFIPVSIINDALFEGNPETFSLNLSDPTGTDVQLMYPSSTTVMISDNDTQPRISNQNTNVNETGTGTTSTATVTVSLSNPSVQTVTVNYATANGTATAGKDYEATSGTLTFAPSETTKTISILTYGDNNIEPNETFFVNLSNSVNGTILVPQATVTIMNFVPQSQRPKFDFDGDAKTDLSIFRPSVGEWWYLRSSDGGNYAAQFGNSTDKLVPGDYTGDGKADIAIWRPVSGEWFILRSEDGSYYSFPFGTNGDIPAVGDFDGDGRADQAVFRPSDTTWYIRRSSDSGFTIQQFGAAGDAPAVADYDGDGKSDIAVWRASAGQWWIQKSSDSSVVAFQFGDSNDKAVQGDYTGDGKADVAIFRPNTGEWFILRSEDFSYYSFPFGTSGDIPAPGDYDGDGKSDATVFRPSDSTWYVQRSTAGTLIQQFGINGDLPVPNAFVP